MDRRQFIKQAIAYSAGLSFSVPEVFALSEPTPDLALVTGAQYKDITMQSIELLGGMSKFVRPGDTVVVKPNIG